MKSGMRPLSTMRFYAPDGTPLAEDALWRIIMRAPFELTFTSNTTHMTYSVDAALRLVRNRPRPTMDVPTTFLPDDALDAERVAKANPHRPGIVYGYRDPDGKPLFDLADGNHRFRRACELGMGCFPVYPLTAIEVKSLELFYAIEDGSAPRPIVYRNLEDE